MSAFAKFLRWILRLALFAFFRRKKVVGHPPEGGVIYILNHPNGLIDPLFILTSAPPGVTFMAKEPLFRMPIVGRMVKAFGCLPIYRAVDGADTKDNKKTLDAADAHLKAGGSIAIFPEGTSHSDTELKPMRTGAARIALSANTGSANVPIVPVGLHYTEKNTFRSDVVIRFGAPMEIEKLTLKPEEPIPRPEVRALTERIDAALRDVTVNGKTEEEILFAKNASTVFEQSRALDAIIDKQQAFIKARQQLPPADKQKLTQDVGRLADVMNRIGMDGSSSQKSPVPLIGLAPIFAVLLGPIGLLAMAIHAPAYQLIRLISQNKRSPFREADQLASMKLFCGLFLFPITWTLLGLFVARFTTPWIGLVVGLLGPLWGYLAMRYHEIIEGLSADATLTYVILSKPRRLARIQAARARLSGVLEPLLLQESSTSPVLPTQ